MNKQRAKEIASSAVMANVTFDGVSVYSSILVRD
ncbi:small, acid-soluble spore protein, H family [Paenibacillus sp. LMG 31456]|uniref:Small, acid-soluble spore protein, H family n=1 Tax=Paenibacillus foliorum TaxID=2654974 RepID=A0A972K4F0_9BACL|nr:small, acid-soluble spore protein, H family [Paenibacillus foliorum]NOU95932.1 small, acid-soluble spore protein, H family [Paenibacillus foliorum]